MRALWFMPMTFLAGIHGFAYFVPYLLLIGLLAMAITYTRRGQKRALVRVHAVAPVQVPVERSEFEFAAS